MPEPPRNSSGTAGPELSGYALKRAAPRGEPSDVGKPPPAPEPETVEAAKQTAGETRPPAFEAAASLDKVNRAAGAAAGRGVPPETQPLKQGMAAATGTGRLSNELRETIAPAEVMEVAVDDIGVFENRLAALLPEFGGRIAGKHATENGLAVGVELPRSREAEFRSALKGETAVQSSQAAASKGKFARLKTEAQERGAMPAAQRLFTEEEEFAPGKDKPTVRIELRVRAKK